MLPTSFIFVGLDYIGLAAMKVLRNGKKIKDRHFFVDQRLFCGMFCLLGTIDASAVREMNL